jgi:hypothetical protein
MVMISSESIFCWELKKRLKIWSFGLVMMEEWRNTIANVAIIPFSWRKGRVEQPWLNIYSPPAGGRKNQILRKSEIDIEEVICGRTLKAYHLHGMLSL